MLQEHVEERVFLAPPQVYELSRIQKITNFSKLQNFAQNRQVYGLERWLPVMATYRDGAITLLPGDDMFPEEPDIIGRKPVPDYPGCVEDIRLKTVNLNRMELKGPTCVIYCNTDLKYGHLSPATYPQISTTSLQTSL